MIQEHAIGYITDIREDGTAVINAALPSLVRAFDRKYNEVEIILNDGRRITALQRKKIFALLGEISEFVHGDSYAAEVEETKEMMKWEFILSRMEAQERRLFSLSNVDESTAREFINYLIDFIIKNDIPTAVPLLENCEDISKYIYVCIANRKCCVCGRPADIHHCEGSHIGMGNDREEVHHLGREVLPLCRVHHDEAHQGSEAEFIEKYHLQPVKLDEALCKKLKLKK
jgi:hypothetical protein